MSTVMAKKVAKKGASVDRRERKQRKFPVTPSDLERFSTEAEELAGEISALVEKMRRAGIEHVEFDGASYASDGLVEIETFIARAREALAKSRTR